MKATFNALHIERAVERMIDDEAKRSGCRIEVDLEFLERVFIASGSRHAVMRLIGLIADHGEECLQSVTP